MTYSLDARDPTRSGLKERVAAILDQQAAGQPAHAADVPHVKTLLCALIDALPREAPGAFYVAEAFGYATSDGGPAPSSLSVNGKVYRAVAGVLPAAAT